MSRIESYGILSKKERDLEDRNLMMDPNLSEVFKFKFRVKK